MATTLYHYTDYRSYLRDLVRAPNCDGGPSLRALSREAGFRSPSFLKGVIDGARNLTRQSTFKVINAIPLEHAEAVYFEMLVAYAQGESDEERNYHYRKILNYRRQLDHKEIIDGAETYFSNWLHVAVREMVQLKNFRDDPLWIACHLFKEVNMADAAKSLELLEFLGLIHKNDAGKYERSGGNIILKGGKTQSILKRYHKHLIDIAKEALELTPKERREFSAITIPVNTKRIAQVKKMIEEFRERIHAMLEEDGTRDEVYQFNMQFFPLTKVNGNGKT